MATDPTTTNGEASTNLADSVVEDDFSDCRTEKVVDEISKCLLEKPGCRHAVGFGYSILCNHPRHKEFWKKLPLLVPLHV